MPSPVYLLLSHLSMGIFSVQSSPFLSFSQNSSALSAPGKRISIPMMAISLSGTSVSWSSYVNSGRLSILFAALSDEHLNTVRLSYSPARAISRILMPSSSSNRSRPCFFFSNSSCSCFIVIPPFRQRGHSMLTVLPQRVPDFTILFLFCAKAVR